MNKRNITLGILLLAGVMANSSTVYGMNKSHWRWTGALTDGDSVNLFAFSDQQSVLDTLRKERKRRAQTENAITKKNPVFPSMAIRLYYENCQICNEKFSEKFRSTPFGKVAVASCGHCYCNDEITQKNAVWKKHLEEKRRREKKEVADYSDYQSKCPVISCKKRSGRLVIGSYKDLADGTKVDPRVLQAERGLRGNTYLISEDNIKLYKSGQRIEQLSLRKTSIDKEVMKKMLYHLDVLAQLISFSQQKKNECGSKFDKQKDAGDIYYIDLIHQDVLAALETSKVPKNQITRAVLALILLSAKYESEEIKGWKKILDNPPAFGIESLILCSYLRYMFAIKNTQEDFVKVKKFFYTSLSDDDKEKIVEIKKDDFNFDSLYDSGKFSNYTTEKKTNPKKETGFGFSNMYKTQYFGQ